LEEANFAQILLCWANTFANFILSSTLGAVHILRDTVCGEGVKQQLLRRSRLGSYPHNLEPTYLKEQVNHEVTPLIWSPKTQNNAYFLSKGEDPEKLMNLNTEYCLNLVDAP
jgi:hypothetical protein